jgi:hypothetical protein
MPDLQHQVEHHHPVGGFGGRAVARVRLAGRDVLMVDGDRQGLTWEHIG